MPIISTTATTATTATTNDLSVTVHALPHPKKRRGGGGEATEGRQSIFSGWWSIFRGTATRTATPCTPRSGGLATARRMQRTSAVRQPSVRPGRSAARQRPAVRKTATYRVAVGVQTAGIRW
jgi:hypothetical protein